MMEAIGRQEEFVTSATNLDKDERQLVLFEDKAKNKINSKMRANYEPQVQ